MFCFFCFFAQCERGLTNHPCCFFSFQRFSKRGTRISDGSSAYRDGLKVHVTLFSVCGLAKRRGQAFGIDSCESTLPIIIELGVIKCHLQFVMTHYSIVSLIAALDKKQKISPWLRKYNSSTFTLSVTVYKPSYNTKNSLCEVCSEI